MMNQIKTVILLGALSGLLLAIGAFVGGSSGMAFGLFIALAMNLGSYWFSDRIVLYMYNAKQVDAKTAPRLHHIVEKAAKMVGIPKPRVYIVPNDTPNAFATGRSYDVSAIATTEGILKLLDDEELLGVIAHEASHIKNRDTLIATIAACIAGIISYVAMMARYGAMFGGFGGRDNDGPNILELLVIGIITPFTAMLIQMAISRSREYLADETGGRAIKNPKALASALRKLERGTKLAPWNGNSTAASLFIVNPFSGKALMSLMSTHPPMDERVKRLNEMKV